MEVEVPLVRPFAGLRPAPAYAAEVAAPPYDVLTSEEARVRASGKPWSFLRVSRAEIDLAPGTDPHAPEVYAKAAENFQRMLSAGVLQRDPVPCFYAYRLIMGSHSQTGIVVAASIAAYAADRIRKHELTRPDKEDDRVRQIEALNAQTGPVLLAHPPRPELERTLTQVSAQAPVIDVAADTGVRHSLWVIDDHDAIAEIVRIFEAMPALYIADGHHRSAAAARVAAARRRANPGHTGEESYNFFLAVAFAHHRMRILPYHRVVRDLNGMGHEAFLARLRERFEVQPSGEPVAPQRRGEFGLYLARSWHRLSMRPQWMPADDPVARLDVSLLADHVLGPLLGIHDARRDERIDFVGGIRGLQELERRVDSGEMACAFSLNATRMEDLMAVADAHRIMPPKSTWFEPKLADGLVSHVLD
jgi:uncharacterized protein (DUF1015 family)